VSGVDPTSPDVGAVPYCYRHRDRETHISCQRCGRKICPDCMRPAAVGFHCPECVKEANAAIPQARTSFGGRLRVGRPIVTYTLIAINVCVWVIVNAAGGQNSEFVRRFAQTNSIDLPQFGWEGVAQGSYWQLLTSNFVHIEALHLGFNMLALWIFGALLEQELGRWRFLAVYLVTGFASSVAVYWLAGETVTSLGASGSVFGLFGVALVVLLKQRRDVGQLLILLALNLVISFTQPDISWQAHIGGLVAGLVIGVSFAYSPREYRRVLPLVVMGAIVVVGVVLVAIRTPMITG